MQISKSFRWHRKLKKILENCELSIGDDAGKDTRDYAVDFKKWNSLFPEFEFRYSLPDGIRRLQAVFRKFQLY